MALLAAGPRWPRSGRNVIDPWSTDCPSTVTNPEMGCRRVGESHAAKLKMQGAKKSTMSCVGVCDRSLRRGFIKITSDTTFNTHTGSLDGGTFSHHKVIILLRQHRDVSVHSFQEGRRFGEEQ